MTTDPKTRTEELILDATASIDPGLHALLAEMEQEHTLVPETPLAKLQKVVKIFRGIQPLLTVLATLPILPPTWRSAIHMLVQALESLAIASPQVIAEFKAGKDLEAES